MITKDITLAADLLIKEDIIGIPTETVYGLAGNIFSEKAVHRIFNIKKRPSFNPLIVHIGHADALSDLAINIPSIAYELIQTFWPGGLTLLLDKKNHIPDIITAGKPKVGIRMPNHPVTLKLLQSLDFPLAAPSANPFNAISPTTAEHVEHYFKDEIACILEGGACEKGLESTIIGFEKDDIIVYRYGAVSVEDIEKITGPVKVQNKNDINPEGPGMLSKHYSPRTLAFHARDLNAALQKFAEKKLVLLAFDQNVTIKKDDFLINLSLKADLHEAAARFYAALHLADEQNADLILIQQFPDIALGKALNDRIYRAAQWSGC